MQRADKRKRSSILSESNERSSKRLRLGNTVQARYAILNGKELESARYITEMLSHGIRSFATGWLLNDTKMTLWYGDRMGVVMSKSFDIFHEAHYLVLFLAAISSPELKNLGISPFVKAPASCNQFDGYEDSTLEFDEADTEHGTVNNLKFRIGDVERLRTDYCAVGRGTTIIPICAIDETSQAMDFGTNDLVAKLAWPLKTRIPESTFVKTVRRRLREERREDMLKHIVDVKCSLIRTMEQMDLPRAFMNLDEPSSFD